LDPAADTNEPTAQTIQPWHIAAFFLSLNWLLGQGEHMRSLTALPAVETYSPSTQSSFFSHWVAGF
jgi:hypothetical protein